MPLIFTVVRIKRQFQFFLHCFKKNTSFEEVLRGSEAKVLKVRRDNHDSSREERGGGVGGHFLEGERGGRPTNVTSLEGRDIFVPGDNLIRKGGETVPSHISFVNKAPARPNNPPSPLNYPSDL